MHLPTIIHIDLSSIENFPLSSLSSSVDLHRLDISYLSLRTPGIVVQTMPKIREFHTSGSSVLTRELLIANKQDGQPAFNLMNLRRLSMTFTRIGVEDEQNIRYLLQNAKLLEKLLDLTVFICHVCVPPFSGFWKWWRAGSSVFWSPCRWTWYRGFHRIYIP